MNETPQSVGAFDVPWPTSAQRMAPLDASMLNGSAAAAAPPLGDGMAAAQNAESAEQALHAESANMRETRDAWIEGVRSTVRSNPLACLAGAIAAGMLISRITR